MIASLPFGYLFTQVGFNCIRIWIVGVAVAELQFCHPEDVPTSENFWKPLCASLQNLLRCNIDIRINLSPISCNRAGFKDSSVSLVMQSREDREAHDPVATNCRTVASSRRDCPS